jgi:hypothetical protein
VAVANAQIGIAQAAFYPTVTLRSTVGFESSSLTNLFSWPSAIWSLGASVVEIVFDGGRRQAVTEQARAVYDATVATYRQTVLTAFRGPEPIGLCVLEGKRAAGSGADGRSDAPQSRIAKGGVDVPRSCHGAKRRVTGARTAIDLLTRRMAATVQLIKAQGGVGDHVNVRQGC